MAPAQEFLGGFRSEYVTVERLIRALAEQPDIDALDVLIGRLAPGTAPFPSKVQLHVMDAGQDPPRSFGFRLKILWFAYWKGRELMQERSYDVIHHLFPYSYRLMFSFWAFQRERAHPPLVIGPVPPPHVIPTERDWLHMLGHLSTDPWWRRMVGWLKIWSLKSGLPLIRIVGDRTLRQTRTIVTMHEEAKQEMLRLWPSEKIEVIPPAPNIDPDPTYHSRPPRPVVELLGIGVMIPRKDFESLIRVFGRLHRDHPHTRLRLIGEGPERPRLERVARELGLSEAVVFEGYVVSSKEYYLSADIFCSTSRSEGFSMAALEAMAYGLPVVAMEAGGFTQLIRSGENGQVVKSGDLATFEAHVAGLINDAALRERMGRKAHALIVEEYTWDAIAKRYVEVYRRATTP